MTLHDASPTEAGAEIELVGFVAGGQSFGLAIEDVHEIRRWSPVTVMPHAPDEMLGVMNLRGAVLPIFDLSALLGLGATPQRPRNVVLIATHGGHPLGLLVEAVATIVTTSAAEIQPPPDIRHQTARRTVSGVITVGADMMRIIDLAALLAPVTLPAAHLLSGGDAA